MPFGDEPGRLRRTDEQALGGRGVRAGSRPSPTSSADKRRFFVTTTRSAGLCALLLALSLVPAAAPSRSALPQRIVSLSPTATEDLFAIGAGPQVIAVDDQSNYPANAPKTKLSGYTPNAEAIAAYNPDLVVASSGANDLVAALDKLHIPVILQPAAPNLAGAYAQLAKLGAVTGRPRQAAAAVAKLRRDIAKVIASVPKAAKGLTFYEELSPDYYSATSKSFTGQVLTLLGLKDIADAADKSGSGYPKLSAEFIVKANPDLIVLADTKCCKQTAAKVSQRAGWSGINALHKGGVIGVSDDIASRWGPRIVDFMRAVAKGATTVASR
jgi:iron complex transport system substrate-binding protein